MEDYLNSLLLNGDAASLAEWMKKQPTRQLLCALKNQKIKDRGVEMSGLIAIARYIKEPQQSFNGISTDLKNAVNFIVEYYVNAGCNVNEVCEGLEPKRRARNKFTPLMLAIEQRKTIITKALLKSGANPNQPDASGYTPLHWAAFTSSNVEIVKHLFNAGADVTKFIPFEVPPVFHIAVDEGRVEIVDFFLSKGVDINTKAPYNVLTEDAWAYLSSRYDCGDMRKYRVQKNISVVGRAVRMRKIDVLEVLLRHSKAEITLDELHFCILEGDSTVANMILKNMDKTILMNDKINEKWALHCLADSAYSSKMEGFEDPTEHTKQLIQTYIDNGWNINAVSVFVNHEWYKSTLLMRCIHNQNSRLASFVLSKGANPHLPIESVKTLNGIENPTALHAAVFLKSFSIIKVFITAGVDFSHTFGPTSESIALTIQISRSLTFFEVLLTLGYQNEIMLEIIKAYLATGNITVEKRHVMLALMGLDEDILLEILLHLPDQVCLKGLAVTKDKLPVLQWFLTQVVNRNQYEYEKRVNVKAVNEIMKEFSERGYNLNDFKGVPDFEEPLVSTAVNMTRGKWENVNSSEMYQYLIECPKIDWNQKNLMGESPLMLALLVSSIHDENRNNPESGTLKIIHELLDRGADASEILINDVLKLRSNLAVHELPLLKKLWWAGAEIRFDSMKDFIADAENVFCDQDKISLKRLDNWIRKTKYNETSLKRLSAVAVRKSLKYLDLEQIKSPQCPQKWLKRYITEYYETGNYEEE